MKNSFKVIGVIISIIVLFALLIAYLPKGNDYINWENNMKKIEQHSKGI